MKRLVSIMLQNTVVASNTLNYSYETVLEWRRYRTLSVTDITEISLQQLKSICYILYTIMIN